MSTPTTIEILTAAGLEMCEAGKLFAIDHADPHAAITAALADRSTPECGSTGLDYLGWEFLRYAANYLPGCAPANEGEFTWPGGAANELDAVRAAVHLRAWLERWLLAHDGAEVSLPL